MIKLIYKIIILTLFLTACKFDGTDTGNPLPQFGSLPIKDMETYKILNASCLKLVDCYAEIDLLDCISLSSKTTNFASKIGLGVEFDYLKMEEIISYEYSGVYVPNVDDSNMCQLDIDGLLCTDPEVIGAYNDSSSNPYQNISDILPLSCNSVF